MLHALALALLLIGIVALLAIAVLFALRLSRFARAAKKLRSHPMFEAEWRNHQIDVARRLTTGIERIQDDSRRLGSAFAKLAMAVEELGALVRASSNATEAVLRSGLPWLAGVLSQRM
jgi:hypothetical protein